jgi:polar amino acid transport system permease protein
MRAADSFGARKSWSPFFLFLALAAGLIAVSGRTPIGMQHVLARLPLLLTGSGSGWPLVGGFYANILMSLLAMGIAMVFGSLLGFAMLSKATAFRWPAFFVMNFLRNSPWIVLLFSMLYVLPFQLRIGGFVVAFPPIAKAVIGLSLPTAANFAEILRGAVQSIHSGQWESARSLGYMHFQIYRHVLLPQAIKRMLPATMNLYALLVVATSLATVTGVLEVLTTLKSIVAVETESTVSYFYIAVLLIFFVYCYPIARWSRRLERSRKGDSL